MYHPGNRDPWKGRVDSLDDYDAFRWHQWMRPVDLDAPARQKDADLVALLQGGKGPAAAR